MKVTAAVLDQVGSEFTLKTLDLADPGPGEVLIEVAGVGVCHTDLVVQHGEARGEAVKVVLVHS